MTTGQTSVPVSYSVCRAVFQEARPSCITPWPSPSDFKCGRFQHTQRLVWAGLLTFAFMVLGRLWRTLTLALSQNHDYIAELWVTAVFSCVAWWWKLGYVALNLLTPLNSCSFDRTISLLKWEKDHNGKNNEACSCSIVYLPVSLAQCSTKQAVTGGH